MPLCYKIDNDNFKLGLWNLVETDSELFNEFILVAPPTEIEKARKFKNPSRKSEWIASRLISYFLLGRAIEIEYNNDGKPAIVDHHWTISISHTKGMVVVILAKNLAGIDIEYISERVIKIEDRFLSKAEKEKLPEENRLLAVLLNWSAKETIYKIIGEKGVDFKKDIFIRPFIPEQEGQFYGEINFQSNITAFSLNYFIYKPKDRNVGYIVVYHYQ
jgi:4'-phosphopantetheinyl transferase